MFSMSSGRVSVSSTGRVLDRLAGVTTMSGPVTVTVAVSVALASATVPSVQRIALLSVNTAVLNEYWLAVVASRLRPAVAEAPAQAANEQGFQFERLGYFVADRYDHKADAPVFNRSVTLRDTWASKA